ncbi:hypothetical protein MYU51_018639 [Penicillium brevicompactum]|uniref:uncharacterized protein n=1 Tax=Penicillium brevicompactum TaxID=5074 RepID=UPI002540F7F1|nr:uncharacterized protein N7506_001682 [Penicillium brevicompactum]KAJ5348429.1 hypothetical protein N7506_001682 [Penicillium brevicompactum]
MSSVFSVSASPGFRTQYDPYTMVTVTAVQTETVRPTWVFTLTGANVTSSTSTIPSQSQNLTTVSTETTELSSSNTAVPTSSTSTTTDISPAPSPTTSPLSSPMEYHPTSTTESSYTDISSSIVATLSLASSRTSRDSPSTVKATISPSPKTSSPTTTMATTTSNAPQTTTSPLTGVVTNATSNASPHSSLSPSTKTGIIVGSVIGGTAVLIFLLAILFRLRRNRSPERGIKQHLLRPSISSTRHSSPTLPTISGPIPPPIRPVLAAHSNPDLSLDSMYWRREQPSNFAAGFPPSDIPASRVASFYSTSSWDGGLGLQEYWDLERGELSKHDSMRSNPFDLEPPPSAHRPPVPVPTPWGIKF